MYSWRVVEFDSSAELSWRNEAVSFGTICYHLLHCHVSTTSTCKLHGIIIRTMFYVACVGISSTRLEMQLFVSLRIIVADAQKHGKVSFGRVRPPTPSYLTFVLSLGKLWFNGSLDSNVSALQQRLAQPLTGMRNHQPNFRHIRIPHVTMEMLV